MTSEEVEALWEEYQEHYWGEQCCGGTCVNYNDEDGFSGAEEFYEWMKARAEES